MEASAAEDTSAWMRLKGRLTSKVTIQRRGCWEFLLYPKEADFHARLETSLLWPADSNPTGFPWTSTGSDTCFLQENNRY